MFSFIILVWLDTNIIKENVCEPVCLLLYYVQNADCY